MKITDRSKSWLMEHAIEQYIEHEVWRVEAIEPTLPKVQQFAAHDEFREWLLSWGTEDEMEPPVCK